MSAFSSLLVGQVTLGSGFEARSFNTSVTLTSLIELKELEFLNEDHRKGNQLINLQDDISSVDAAENLGITNANNGTGGNQRHHLPLNKTL